MRSFDLHSTASIASCRTVAYDVSAICKLNVRATPSTDVFLLYNVHTEPPDVLSEDVVDDVIGVVGLPTPLSDGSVGLRMRLTVRGSNRLVEELVT